MLFLVVRLLGPL
ncbi:hypothetical protein SAMN05660344_02570 [Pseudomonas sp. LAMO17WK12:I11]|nr:hypothetical protein SAMN05660385_02557 [Pseudomonas sp. URIL14HWK12:I5]SNY24592.1 hypothetical protein SAMN05660344_02570 [Pseudomonas sp. LAMO17WK12:I11]